MPDSLHDDIAAFLQEHEAIAAAWLFGSMAGGHVHSGSDLDVAIHAYRTIDWEIVHSITHERLGDFQQFARAVLVHIDAA